MHMKTAISCCRFKLVVSWCLWTLMWPLILPHDSWIHRDASFLFKFHNQYLTPSRALWWLGMTTKEIRVFSAAQHECWWLHRSLFSNHVMRYPNRLTQILVRCQFKALLKKTAGIILLWAQGLWWRWFSNLFLVFPFFFLCYHRTFRIFFPFPSIGFELSKILQIAHQMLRI